MIRLALVSFMTTAWFLSRSYTTTMYLVLGLATAAIALQPSDNESARSRPVDILDRSLRSCDGHPDILRLSSLSALINCFVNPAEADELK